MGFFPSLPKPPGPLPVSTFTLESPIESTPHTPHPPSPAQPLKTSLIRVYYPCEPSTGTRRAESWIPRPFSTYIKGNAHFLRVPPFLVWALSCISGLLFTRLPCRKDATPLKRDGGWPTMLFSHGLGGSRGAYAAYCAGLASHGVVVAAIEHRDGSAAVSYVSTSDGKGEEVPYVRVFDKKVKEKQVHVRTYEFREALRVLRALNAGHPVEVANSRWHAKDFNYESWKGVMNVKKGQIIAAGHSFGGATALSACKDIAEFRLSPPSNSSSSDNYPFSEEFAATILLDPWMSPTTSNTHIPLPTPTLTVLSGQFYKWSQNLTAVKELHRGRKESRCWVATRSAHLSQSDFGALFPWGTKKFAKAEENPVKVLEWNIEATRAFLRAVGVDGIGEGKDVDKAIWRGEEGWEEVRCEERGRELHVEGDFGREF